MVVGKAKSECSTSGFRIPLGNADILSAFALLRSCSWTREAWASELVIRSSIAAAPEARLN